MIISTKKIKLNFHVMIVIKKSCVIFDAFTRRNGSFIFLIEIMKSNID